MQIYKVRFNLGEVSSGEDEHVSGILIRFPQGDRINEAEIAEIIAVKNLIKKRGQEFGVYLSCFDNELLFKRNFDQVPVDYRGINYIAKNGYYPICPNSPEAERFYYDVLAVLSDKIKPDILYVDNLGFPYDWVNEPLDVKDAMPKFCYCPYCLAEFSSVIGVMITNGGQIMDYMWEWLDWRSSVISRMVFDTRKTGASKIILSIPPLFLIDVPFVTGQEVLVYVDEGFVISPKFLDTHRESIVGWYKNIMEQVSVDIPADSVIISVSKQCSGLLEMIKGFTGQFSGFVIFD